MKIRLIIVLTLIFHSNIYGQDRVLEMFDSLKNVYFYKNIVVNPQNTTFIENKSLRDKLYEDRIRQLAKNSPFNYVYNSTVENYINRYVKNPKSVSTIIALSKLYFPLYEKYLSQYKIPLELKYLSMVESALNPTAKSKCGATGLWQFMYGTAKAYNLKIDSYVDERFDPEMQTIAACEYLSKLFNDYGDWSLAIAAYNCGEGNVNKAIRKAGVKDFWEIKTYLPVETQNYVPAFIAASYIMTYSKEHNMTEASIKILYDDLDFINVNEKRSLKEVSKILNIPTNELYYLNPKYYLGIVPENNKIIVPKEKALLWMDFENNKLEFYPEVKNKINKTTNVPQEVPQKDIEEVSQKTSSLMPLKCVVYGDQKLSDGGIVLIRNIEAWRFEGVIIPINSIIKVKAYFSTQLISFKTISASTINGEVLLNLNGSLDHLNSKRPMSVTDGLVLILII